MRFLQVRELSIHSVGLELLLILLSVEHRMGKPITAKIHNERMKSAHGMGLDLPRGPDPRSKQANTAVDELMRKILGMDD